MDSTAHVYYIKRKQGTQQTCEGKLSDEIFLCKINFRYHQYRVTRCHVAFILLKICLSPEVISLSGLLELYYYNKRLNNKWDDP